MKQLLAEIELLRRELNSLRELNSYRIVDALELEYTFESNRIEGNTLTLIETDLVINKGLTIGGKSMREHLEAINHQQAIGYIKDVVQSKIEFSLTVLLNIHALILRAIDADNAGQFRKVQVYIQGSKHIPSQPFLVPKQMEDYFIWYNENKLNLHPVLLSAEMHERLVSIHPFIDGNGRTARLVMNLILLQHGFVIANLKGDVESRVNYYHSLENAQLNNNKNDFLKLVATEEKNALLQYLKIIKGEK